MSHIQVSTEPQEVTHDDSLRADGAQAAGTSSGFGSSAAAFHDILAVGAQAGNEFYAGDTNGTRPAGRPADAAPAGDVPELAASNDFFSTARQKQPFWRMKLALPKKRTTGDSGVRRSSKGRSKDRRPLPHS